ncbi:hypothetical protein RND81_08G015200 [Saponaria officinalis]|uniref:F-box protein At3g26010-like beta-propeller domain-containing protein n=1 Tax=Saponaria officinalis TaxID=3572 RepID=A0AAW1J2L8_SAPOF
MAKRSPQTTDLCLMNSDIPFDVLSRLPADKLVQLRHVSKQWQKFISDAGFRDFHTKKAEPISISGYFFQERFEYSEIDVKTLSYIPLCAQKTEIYRDVLSFLPEKVTILGSSNGLVCCRSCIPSRDPSIYICNPVTKESTKLKWDNFQRRDNIFFSFEPTSSPVNAVRDYKLVKVFETEDFTDGKEDYFFAFEIYDWETKKWRKSKEVCHSEDSLCTNKRILLKDILYCLTDGLQILTFDIENELSFLISLPLTITDSKFPEICLGESDGVLNCVVLSQDALLVWALVDRFTPKWDLVTFIPFEEMEQENPEHLFNLTERVKKSASETAPWMHLLAFKDGNLFLRVSNSAFSFDIQSRKMQSLCSILDLGRQVIVAPTVVPYAMTLAPLANQ